MFWTIVVPDDAVEVDMTAGTATLAMTDVAEKDYHDIENAILRNGPTPRPGRVSFTVRWTAAGAPVHFDNVDQQYRGDVSVAAAQMEWSGRAGDFEFRSAPLGESKEDFAQFGLESNGSFY